MERRSKGGLVTMPFIIANEAFEKVTSFGLIPNMIIYMMNEYHIGVAKGASILFLWSASSNFMPLVGALVSDSFLGRFSTILVGSFLSLSGTAMLWLTAMLPDAKPPPCDVSHEICQKASPTQMAMLLASFALLSLGAGGVRPCSLAFGADQLNNGENPNNSKVLESFFGWYYASASAAILLAFTGVVYLQDRMGWKIGFGVPAIFMLVSVSVFLIASPLYLKVNSDKNVLSSMVQVSLSALRNRRLKLTEESRYHSTAPHISEPTSRLTFLNKACVITNEPATSQRKPATVEQVEELKALIRVLPIWSTGIMLSINTSQNAFPVLQASSMERHRIPAASFAMFLIITLTAWVSLYDRVILPLASKIRGRRVNLGVKLRMGIGLALSCLAMAVSAIVEKTRRTRAVSEGQSEDPRGVVRMSAMWLVPQYCLLGLAEAFNAIGQMEFYYSELPRSMSSIAGCLFGVGMAVANLAASGVLRAVEKTTTRGGGESWVSDNINQGSYDNYYWLLAALSAVNLPYFVLCSWAYGPCREQQCLLKENVNENGSIVVVEVDPSEQPIKK